MAVTNQEKIIVLAKLYPKSTRRIVNDVLEVGTEDGSSATPIIDLTTIDFDTELANIELERAKTKKLAEIDKKRVEISDGGMEWEFPSGIDYVQTRERDRILLLGVNSLARDYLAAGITDPVISFRSQSNEQHMITPEQAIALTTEAAMFVGTVYEQSWIYKDAVLAATTVAEVEAISWV